MQTVNLGILAHVDAGKTSLTERLLHATGVIDQLGSVDAGTTQTDTGEIERRRGITIRSAVAAFGIRDRQVNLLDTPGHGDFVAEVERALGVLDAAILVLSAVEGVQPHSRRIMRILRSLRLPTLIFVNKIDRVGARTEDLVADVRRLLTPAVFPLGTVRAPGTPGATFRLYDPRDDGENAHRLAETLAEHDDELLVALVDDLPSDPDQFDRALRVQAAAGQVHPLLFGSALSGAGIPELLDSIAALLPASPPAEPEPRARVFAVERDAAGGRVAYLRSYGGQLRARQRVIAYRREPDGRITATRARITRLDVVDATPDQAEPTGREHETNVLTAGYIARLAGLTGVRLGDQLGSPVGLDGRAHFPAPTLEVVVRPRDPARVLALHAALLDIADADSFLQARVTPDGDTSVLLYGEVQREVLTATLAEAYGIETECGPGRLMHIERPTGVGTAVEIIGQGFYGTVGFRVEPGTGVDYRLEVELGSLPLSFHKAIEDATRAALDQGRHGWPVTDIRITLTHSGYWSPITTAGHFRDLAPYVLMQALAQAGTRVFEPCRRFEAEVPADRLGAVTSYLVRLGARIDGTDHVAAGWRIGGLLPVRFEPEAQRRLLDVSSGEGLWSSVPGGDRPMSGDPPCRPRTDGDPFDRTEYLRFLAQPRTRS
ncbi:TetM/TetW/TetO/TetS family tetracycline resistance ribosomal protection protein [Micromonospora sp. D93]|uniref:elongation factor G n=1 Tax=Micromonospora sp. D93 TaxID=2824886 RepID=UPI001B36C7F3|nr:TetM/TetW/TetO/TetS family tetracycline resistance ribosomal protection protein [Micromonospora sp. D93]MBQ1016954.1 TetM/TetW/TetO/TetS family tetracycline resistance ribosomal protection protein [Micromonospora sp. D93]